MECKFISKHQKWNRKKQTKSEIKCTDSEESINIQSPQNHSKRYQVMAKQSVMYENKTIPLDSVEFFFTSFCPELFSQCLTYQHLLSLGRHVCVISKLWFYKSEVHN